MSTVSSLFKSAKNRHTRIVGDDEAGTLWTTPWSMRDENFTYWGSNGQAWLYQSFPLSPLEWEDASTRLALGDNLSSLLNALGATSRVPIGALRSLAKNREIHLVSTTWDAPLRPPASTPPKLQSYFDDCLDFMVPHRMFLVGVRLWPSDVSAPKQRKGHASRVASQLKAAAVKVLAEDVPDRAAYEPDRKQVSDMLSRFGCSRLTVEQAAQLEAWYNLGRTADVSIDEQHTTLNIPAFGTVEMSAVMRFNNRVLHAPDDQWVSDLLAHPDAPKVVSIRAELEPATTTRARARMSQRRLKALAEEEAETGDVDRVEITDTYQQAEQFETFLVSSNEPILTNCSILMGRVVDDVDETYMDFLSQRYGAEMKPLEHRQLFALDETLPCSPKRVNPFVQDVTINMVSFAGLHGFSELGDPAGIYVGLADPHLTPVFLDPLRAPQEHMPATMLVAGDSGSGKTFLSQNLALQSVLLGHTTIFINPKGFSTLASFAELVDGTVIKMSALEKTPGAFDPFRYAPPPVAAEIAAQHILDVLEDGFTQQQRLGLGAALKRAAVGGVGCVGEALDWVEDPDVVTQVRQQALASSWFALGIADEPRPPFESSGGLTLIEFDRKLDLPDSSKTASEYTTAEKLALAAMRLVVRAAGEILANAGGGVLMADEAWTFLQNTSGLAALQAMSREGRSQNILPILLTQRVADVLSSDLEGYLSRVFCMKLSDPADAKAALRLCGLEPTPARLSWLASCGPRNATDENPARWSMGIHRDLRNRHAAVMIGPVPEAARYAFSTAPDEVRARQHAAETDTDPADPAAPAGPAGSVDPS